MRTSPALSPRLLDLFVVVLVVGYCVVMLRALDRWPPVDNDEGREANVFWVMAHVDPEANQMNEYHGFANWGTGGLQGMTTAAIFRLGGIGIFQARLTSLIWGGGLLLLSYAAGSLLWNRAVASAAVGMLAVSDPFLVSSHVLRPDVQTTFLTMLAWLTAEIGFRRRWLWAHLTAGVVLGFSADVHLNTFAFIPFTLLVYLLRFGFFGVWRRRESWLLALGLALGAGYYLVARVLPDPGSFLGGLAYWVGQDKRPPVDRPGLGFLGPIQLEAWRYWDYFQEELPELALVLSGLVFGLWRAVRGGRSERFLLAGLASAQVFFLLFVSSKSKYYMIFGYPYYMMLAAAAGWWVIGRPRPPPRIAHAALGVLAVLVAIGPLKLEDRAWDNYIRASRYRAGQDYYQLMSQLRALAPADARVMAPPRYWFGFHDHHFTDIFVFERVRRQEGMSASRFLDEIEPDLVIVDAKIATDRAAQLELFRALDQLAPYEVITRNRYLGDVAVYRPRR
ncbi:MAG: glycosyltransferase family 39 protein [Chloroflexi bacterium]|nr:glycosyltransferase family 39 protein [Chloroflexota bacterium]